MIDSLCISPANSWPVKLKHTPPQKINAFLRKFGSKLGFEVDNFGCDVPKQFLDGVSVEGESPGEHVIQQNSAGPHVALVVVEPLDHLGGHVQWRPRLLAQFGPFFKFAGDSPVDQFDVPGLLALSFGQFARFPRSWFPVFAVEEDDHDVLRLDVAMHDVVRVAVVQGLQQLVHDFFGFGLGEAPLFVDDTLESNITNVHDHVNVSSS